MAVGRVNSDGGAGKCYIGWVGAGIRWGGRRGSL